MIRKIQGAFLMLTLIFGLSSVPLLHHENGISAAAVEVEAGAEVEVEIGSGNEPEEKGEMESEAGIEIEVYVEGNQSTIEIEMDGEDNTYILDTSSRAEIIAKIQAETNLTEDEIKSIWKFHESDEMKSEVKAESEIEIGVYVKGNQTRVEIEMEGKENTYIFDTSSKTEIIAKIMAETNLTEDEITSIWKYEDSESKMKAKMMLESEIKAKTAGIANANLKAKERSKILINSIEHDVEDTDQRLHAIMAKARAHGFLKSEASSSAKAYGVSLDGMAKSQTKSGASMKGDIYLEEMTKMKNVAKYRVSGGTLSIDGQTYEVLFGKARATSDGGVESRTKMILIAEVMKPEGDITTMKILLQSESSLRSQSDIQWNILSPQSKIAGGWTFDAQGNMSVLSA